MAIDAHGNFTKENYIISDSQAAYEHAQHLRPLLQRLLLVLLLAAPRRALGGAEAQPPTDCGIHERGVHELPPRASLLMRSLILAPLKVQYTIGFGEIDLDGLNAGGRRCDEVVEAEAEGDHARAGVMAAAARVPRLALLAGCRWSLLEYVPVSNVGVSDQVIR